MYIYNIQRENHTYIIFLWFFVCPRSCDVLWNVTMESSEYAQPFGSYLRASQIMWLWRLLDFQGLQFYSLCSFFSFHCWEADSFSQALSTCCLGQGGPTIATSGGISSIHDMLLGFCHPAGLEEDGMVNLRSSSKTKYQSATVTQTQTRRMVEQWKVVFQPTHDRVYVGGCWSPLLSLLGCKMKHVTLPTNRPTNQPTSQYILQAVTNRPTVRCLGSPAKTRKRPSSTLTEEAQP